MMKDDFYERYSGKAGDTHPKYVQLSEAIASAIKDGYWESGSKLPSEAVMARTTPFSLGTVQKALRVLAEQGVIERRHGHGTFVSRAITGPWHFRFPSGTRGAFLPLYAKVIGRKVVRKKVRWAALLAPGEGELIQIDRMIKVGQSSSVYNVFYISLERYPAFWEKPIRELDSANLKTILQEEYKENVTRASNFMTILSLPPKVCDALGLRRKTAGALLETLASSSAKKPLYCTQLYIPPGPLKLFISESPNRPDFWL